MKRSLKNIFITLFLIFITHYLMVIIHMLFHTTLAWAFGFIKNPFNFDYYQLTIFLVDKQTSFNAMLQSGHNILAAILALVPNFANAVLSIICLSLISSKKIQEKKYLYYFLYWFMIMNMGQVYSYVYRSFQLPGDVQIFSKSLNISAYWIFLPGTFFIFSGYLAILAFKIPQAYKVLKISKTWHQAVFLFISLLVLFGYFGGFVYEIMQKQYFYLIYPISFTILFFMICYPSNKWVQNRLQKL